MFGVGTLFGAVTTYTGNAYGGSGQRATFLTLLPAPALTYDMVDLASECVSPCAYSFNRNTATTTNISGQTISGITFSGANTGAAGNNLQVRPLNDGTRNSGGGPSYNTVTANGAYSQMVYLFSTAPGVSGTPSMNISFAPTPGVRSVAFDYASISNLGSNDPAGFTITTTSANTPNSVSTINRYDASQSAAYAASGPGFYGITSTEDILTISIVANASSSQWIINLANFRVGVQINSPVPEPGPQLTMGAALILISLLLRYRSKIATGGKA
ncbi:MAG: hypothetical protein K2X03_17650 [Bryobacteraceae bacterium]|nr:hypothetical protein [Bryobacteraceae bacterium]